jgi:hypothetical protein
MMGKQRLFVAILVSMFVLVAACGGDDDLLADAGSDLDTPVGVSPTFDGCSSEGDIVNFAWSIVEAPESMQSDIGKSIRDESGDCSFELESAMLAEEVGDWVVELVVTDSSGNTSADRVEIRVIG